MVDDLPDAPWTSGTSDLPDAPWAGSKPPAQDDGALSAAGTGAINALTFGSAPAIAGLREAAGTAWSEDKLNPFGPVVGAAKMLSNWVSEHPDPAVKEAYERGRSASLKGEEAAQQQHPYAYLAGQLSGSVLTPLGAVGGATTAARLARGAIAGGIGGGLYGAGSGISENESPVDIAKRAGIGAAIGAPLGGGGAGIAEGLGSVGTKAGSVFRGAYDPEAEAARRVANRITQDWKTNGPPLTQEEIAAANLAGTPRALVDLGGAGTKALERSAANMSPEARQALSDFTQNRFEQQSPRISGFIRDITGAQNAGADDDLLRAAARKANKPLYKAAYDAGDRVITSPTLEQLSTSPTVESAMKSAVAKWKDWQVLDGYGGMNPPVITPDGLIKFGGKGVPAYPNIQFWDYTSRVLSGLAQEAKRAGNYSEAARYGGLERLVKSELDTQVPEFASARGTAATFFKAQDAGEAGRDFARGYNSAQDLFDANKALTKMSAPERELFARGFANELAGRVDNARDKSSVINQAFLDSQTGRNKIEMALGPQRSAQLEALLRAESVVDTARRALGNSTTTQQSKELGMSAAGNSIAGAGAVAGFEGLYEHSFNPAHVIAGALMAGAVKKGAYVIDERVARHIGQMLVSNDPAILARGVQQVSRTPKLLNALRYATGAGVFTGTANQLPNVNKPLNQGFAHGGRVKLSHEKVGYVDHSTRAKQKCGLCAMYQPPTSCDLVKSPVYASGYCRRFVRKK